MNEGPGVNDDDENDMDSHSAVSKERMQNLGIHRYRARAQERKDSVPGSTV